MSKNELFFQSNDKVTNIHMVTWVPDNEVLGIVQINHGVSEHIGRYAEFAPPSYETFVPMFDMLNPQDH